MTRDVLYVDGDPDRRSTVRAALAGPETEVRAVAGADRAVAALRERSPDCVVSEYRLPATDGLSFFERIYPRYPDVGFVLYTGHGSESLAGEALAAGVDGYVPRSAGVETLRDRVAAAAGDGGAAGGDGGRSGGHRSRPDDVDGRDAGEGDDDRDDPTDGAVPKDPPSLGDLPPDPGSVRRVFESVGDTVYTLDPQGRITWTDGALVEAGSYDREDLVGEHVSAIMPEADVRRGAELIADLLDGARDESRTFETTLRDEDGRGVPCEVTLSLIPGEDGPAGTVGVVREVSERKRVERHLREEKARIRTLHAVASRLVGCRCERAVHETTVEAAAAALDLDGCAVHVVADGRLRPAAHAPDRVRGDGGWTVDAVGAAGEGVPGDVSGADLGTDLDGTASAVDPADPPADLPEYAAPRAVGEAVRAARQSGAARRVDDCRGSAGPDFETHRSLLVVPVGDDAVFCGAARDPGAFDAEDADLAEILAAHAADALERVGYATDLRRERDRFAALFENVPDPVVHTTFDDGDPVVTAANPAFEETFGLPEREIAGESLDDYLVPAGDDARAEAADINRRAMEGDPVETVVRRRTDEGLRTFVLTVFPVELPEGIATFGHYTDVTERRQRRRRLEVLNRVLRHDLRNGMNVVKAAAELLERRVDDEGREFVEKILDRADDLLSMAEKTRTVERTLDAGETAGPVDVADCVRAAVEEYGEAHPEATVRVDAPDRALVTADEFVDRAVEAVVENALVHHDREEPTVTASVDVETREDGPDLVLVEVADDGPGIPDEERVLFDRDREITQLRHASGLGLWLVNWVVARAGGELAFEENEPRGTVVRIRLPRAREPPALGE